MSGKKRAVAMAGVFVVGLVAGGALMYSNSVYDAVNDALGKGATQNAVAVGAGGVTSIDVSNMDLETALMAVQSERKNLLDQQLQEQIKQVQERNDQIAKLNNVLAAANGVLRYYPSDAKAEDAIPASAQQAVQELKNAISASGVTDLAAPANKGQCDTLIQNVKGRIDAASNSQQMDMLRLQSLSNKRNEAFDVMTNFIKKMQDSRSSIIGNMR